jgi:hypothetical protein
MTDVICMNIQRGGESFAPLWIWKLAETLQKMTSLTSFTSRISEWYKQALATGMVHQTGQGGDGGAVSVDTLGHARDNAQAPGCSMDVDAFCDLVLYCHYQTRTLKDASHYQGFSLLPPIPQATEHPKVKSVP